MENWYKTLLLGLLILSLLPINTMFASAQTTPEYKWVFMVYLDADNNLEGAGISDFNEMEMAGSTDEVAIVVMIDRHPGYDTSNGNWTTTRIYLVQHDVDPNVINSTLLVDLGETNMGDPNTLVFFVNYTVTHFPAEHYALVLWDHGNAWRRGLAPGQKGVCWDYSDGYDYITEQELLWALDKISSLGIHLDLIGFDVCLLGMVEIAYDIASRGYADVLVASQEFEPWDGWYYTPFLQELVAKPNMTAQELAAKIVEAYKTFYTTIKPLDYPTLAAIDLNKFISTVVPNLDMASLYLLIDVYLSPELSDTIKTLRDDSEKTGEGEFIDIYDFFEKINETDVWPSSYDPRPYVNATLYYLDEAIIAQWAASGHPNAHGLSIYIPPTVDWYLEERYWYFQQTLFPTETYWGLFLDYYFKAFTPTEEFVVRISAPTQINAGEEDYALVQITFGNKKVDPDYLTVTLMTPTGESIPLSYTKVASGTYLVAIPPIENVSTVFIIVDTGYWFLERTTSAAVKVTDIAEKISEQTSEIKSVINESTASLENLIENKIAELSSLLNETNAQVLAVKKGVAYINTTLGLVELKLTDIGATIEAINNDTVTIKTILGEIKVELADLNTTITYIGENIVAINTTLGTIYGKIVSIEGDVATIKTDIGTIKTTVDKITGLSEQLSDKQSTAINLSYAIAALVVLALVLSGVSILRRG
ncbi:hypothetical protein J4526_06015 [Desulfurococcaceae archaeon MEX13E-LK6-19]|nr:hypothetical protein J4526_06015 [Desulfurococcaceae archaeon MEX13E-LK6-19]